jgi:hypothetical protein
MWFASLLPALVILTFMGLIGLALATYARRTWQLIRRDDPENDQSLLDAVDRLETQLRIVNDRLDRIERKGIEPPG